MKCSIWNLLLYIFIIFQSIFFFNLITYDLLLAFFTCNIFANIRCALFSMCVSLVQKSLR